MRRTTTRACALLSAVIALVLLTPVSALAHEERKVGKFAFLVGWAVEPTYAGYPNAVLLLLADAAGKPVNNLGDTLKVDVTFSGQTTSLALEPAFEVGEFGVEGEYHADLVPTRPGTFAFHFTGTVRGQKVDETFTCGEKTFDCVKDPAEVQFPAKDPGNAALDEKINRTTNRLGANLNAVSDDASNAKVIGYVGMGLGAVALVYALLLGRKKTSP
jgi:hypothetical protein